MTRFAQNIITIMSIFLNGYNMKAQSPLASPAGVYYLQGVREMASELVLKPDHSFEFLYSYGAVDRGGKGHWEIDKNDSSRIILNSAKRPLWDFALLSTKNTNDDRTVIKITDPNKMLLSYVSARIHTANNVIEKRSDREGYIIIPKQPITKIELLFELCPERFSTFVVSDSMPNDFEFRFQPWIAEVFFENIALTITEKGLIGSHPLLKGNDFEFEKANQ